MAHVLLVMQFFTQSGPEQDGDEEPEQRRSGNTDLHAQCREGEEIGAGQSSRPRTACEGGAAEEQCVSVHAETNT